MSAVAAGVGDRVRFEQRDAAQGLPEQFDLVMAAFVIHDADDPLAALRAIRGALRPGGAFLCVEFAAAERVEENIGPMGALGYGSSLFYCLPTALANGSVGLGALGLPEARLRELCLEAGFSSVQRVSVPPPRLAVYEVKSE